MKAIDVAHETFHSLDTNRARSFLTILGIVIGIAAVVVMTSLIGGVKNTVINSMGLDAARVVNIYPPNGVQERQLDAIRLQLPEFEFLDSESFAYIDYTHQGEPVSVYVTGVTSQTFNALRNESISKGRFFTEEEILRGSPVLLLDLDGVRLLYGDPNFNPVGQQITLGNTRFEVVGVMDRMWGNNFSLDAYAPKAVVIDRLNGEESTWNIIGKVCQGTDTDAAAEHAQQVFESVLRIPSEGEGVMVSTMASAIEELENAMFIFQILAIAVSSIALLVGGIGIMNMMLTNVTERIREIGLRKAIGATKKDITTQFLSESIALCLTGGVIGTIFGYTGSWIGALVIRQLGSEMGLASFSPAISFGSVMLVVGICVGIGVVFGYYPARRAAKMDPIEALRYQ